MEYVIRKIKPHEVSRLVQMCEDHARFEQSDYSRDGKSDALHVNLFRVNPTFFCYVIETSGWLIGYFTYTFDFSTWDARRYLHLDCLYLEPPYRGMRIGVKVFGDLRRIAQENECTRIQWQTPRFNERAIRFYNRMHAVGKEKMRFSLDV